MSRFSLKQIFEKSLPFAAVALAVASITRIGGCASRPSTPPEAQPVRVVEIRHAADADSARLSGEIRARYEVDLGFRLTGKLVERMVDVGSSVKQGQTLARLDPSDAELGEKGAKARLTAAKSELNLASSELTRHQDLLGKGFVSRAQYDQAVTRHEAARAKVDAGLAEWRDRSNQRDYTLLLADRDGVITQAAAEPGQVLAAGQTVFRLAYDNNQEVAVDVPESLINDFAKAGVFQVSLWTDPAQTLQGRLRELGAAADPLSRTFRARITLADAPANWRYGMSATVRMSQPREAGDMLLPSAAVIVDGNGYRVWKVNRETLSIDAAPVQVKAMQQQQLIVTNLPAGTWVVAAGVHLLHQGQTIRLYNGKPQPYP